MITSGSTPGSVHDLRQWRALGGQSKSQRIALWLQSAVAQHPGIGRLHVRRRQTCTVILLLMIRRMDYSGGSSFVCKTVSWSMMAEYARTSPSSIKRAIATLKQMGLLHAPRYQPSQPRWGDGERDRYPTRRFKWQAYRVDVSRLCHDAFDGWIPPEIESEIRNEP